MSAPVKKVLCLGDSLTEGYHFYGTAYHPYSTKLQALLEAHLKGLPVHFSSCFVFLSMTRET